MASKPLHANYDEELESKLNGFVDKFEEAYSDDDTVNVGDYLPPSHDPSFRLISLELLRVDLQRRIEKGRTLSLRDYRRRFPQVLDRPVAFADLAFEEYRTRVAIGETVSPESYGQKYQIDVSEWPRLSDSTYRLTAAANSTIVDQLQQAASATARSASPRDAVRAIKAGDAFFDFELLEHIGTGTFAEVFIATQPKLSNRQTVLKITAISDREAQQLARLQHTHIVPIYSVHQSNEEGLTAVCMPYFGPCTLRDVILANEHNSAPIARHLTGATFDEVINARHAAVGTSPRVDESKHGRWSELRYVDACVLMGHQIAMGLDHAHHQGIVHGDLKPANVLIADHGPAMLLDFNLSDRTTRNSPMEKATTRAARKSQDRPSSRAAHDQYEARSVVGGTLSYAAPEHLGALLTGRRIEPSTDLYSLGVVLYHLLTGRLPFPSRPGTSEFTIREMIADREALPPTARRYNPNVSVDVESILLKLLAPQPVDRYATARDVAEDLQRHLQHQTLRYAPNRSWRERIEKWNRRHPRLTTSLVAGILLAVAITGFTGFMARQRQATRRASAVATFDRLAHQLPVIRAYTSIPGADNGLLERGLKLAESNAYHEVVDELPFDQQPFAHRLLSETYYHAAHAHLQLAKTATDDSMRQQHLKAAQRFHESAMKRNIDEHATSLQKLRASIEALRDHQTTPPTPGGAVDRGDEFIHAIDAIQSYQHEEAIVLLERLREQNPFDLSLWLLLGNSYSNTGQLEQAEHCFTTCAVLWKDSPLGYFQRGLCRLDIGDFKAAADDFGRVLDIDPDLIAANINRAVALRKLGRHKEALRDLDRAISQGAEQTRVYFMRSESRQAVGDHVGSKLDFQQGLRRKPHDEQSYIRRGLALLHQNPDAAMQDFQAAVELNPRSYQGLRNWAYVVGEKQNQPEAAIVLLNRILDFRPDHPPEIVSRGVMLARIQDCTAAIADGERALQLSDDAKTRYQVACIYALCSKVRPTDKKRALTLLTQAIDEDHQWRQLAKRDPDLASLREDRSFRNLIELP